MPPIGDPETRRKYGEALSHWKCEGYVVWKPGVEERLSDCLPGYTKRAIKGSRKNKFPDLRRRGARPTRHDDEGGEMVTLTFVALILFFFLLDFFVIRKLEHRLGKANETPGDDAQKEA